MSKVIRRILAVGLVSGFALANAANAATILQFGQVNPSDAVTATESGGVTTLTTNSATAPGSIPVNITNIGGIPLPVPQLADETFVGVHSVGTATTTNGVISQVFTGTIEFTSLPGGAGTNFLTATFTDTFSGPVGTGAPTLGADSSVAGETVTFTSSDIRVTPFLPGGSRNFSLSFSNVTPGLSIVDSSIAGFTGQQSGTFAVVPAGTVPEPGSVVLSGIAVMAGLGTFVRRRFKAARA